MRLPFGWRIVRERNERIYVEKATIKKLLEEIKVGEERHHRAEIALIRAGLPLPLGDERE